MQDGPAYARGNVVFALACACAYALAVLVIPPYTPLLEADSAAYLAFSAFRPALYPAFLALCRAAGLDLIQTTWVQIALFSAALAYLLLVLQRVAFPRWLLAALVALLAVNVLFSSFHRSIMSEALYFPLGVVATALWIEFMRKPGLATLGGAGLALGLMIGVRVVGVAIFPLHLLLLVIRRPRAPLWLSLAIAVFAPVLGAGGERMLHYSVHGGQTASQAPALWMGKAAMLVKPTMTFGGPHAQSLQGLASALYDLYGPLQAAVAAAPSAAVKAQLSAIYEGYAQYRALNEELAAAAVREAVSAGVLQSELGRQVILQDLPGYLRLTLLNYLGQWSIAAQRFPPTARALSAYAAANPAVSFGGRIPRDLLNPPAMTAAYVIYPAFLVAGVATLLLGLGFAVFVLRPNLADTAAGFYLLIACFLGAACQAYTVLISLVNEWTPRFLMAVFPQLEIIAACLLLAFAQWVRYPIAAIKSN